MKRAENAGFGGMPYQLNRDAERRVSFQAKATSMRLTLLATGGERVLHLDYFTGNWFP